MKRRQSLERLKKAAHNVETAKHKYEQSVHNFLRLSGWGHTCDVPGAYWLWCKALPDGRTALVDSSIAYGIELRLREIKVCKN